MHWEGYSHKENTWEPEANLRHNVLLESFLDKQKRERRIKEKEKVKAQPAPNWGPSSASHAVSKRDTSNPSKPSNPKSSTKDVVSGASLDGTTKPKGRPLSKPSHPNFATKNERAVLIWASIDSGTCACLNLAVDV